MLSSPVYGTVWFTIQTMVRIWKPKNTTKKHEPEAEFNGCKLTEVHKPPDEWFQVLAGIVIRLNLDFGIKYNNNKVVGHILHNLTPKEYEHVIDSRKRDISHGIAVDLEDVKEDIWENMEISPNEKASKTNIRKTLKRLYPQQVVSRRTLFKVIAVCAVKRVTRVQTAGKTRQTRIKAPLSTRAPTSVATVVETILVGSAVTAIKRVTKRKHVSKRNEIRAIATLNRLKLCGYQLILLSTTLRDLQETMTKNSNKTFSTISREQNTFFQTRKTTKVLFHSEQTN
jgi:hypothetical protein